MGKLIWLAMMTLICAPLVAQEESSAVEEEAVASEQEAPASWPLVYCGVCGVNYKSYGKEIWVVSNGGEVPICSDDCVKSYNEDPKLAEKKFNFIITASFRDNYPLDQCFMDEEELGDNGEPVVIAYRNQVLKFCQESCHEKFQEDRKGGMEKQEALVVEKFKPEYPLIGCIVCQSVFLENKEAIHLAYQNDYYKICSEECIAAFGEDRAKYQGRLKLALVATGRFNTSVMRKAGEELPGPVQLK